MSDLPEKIGPVPVDKPWHQFRDFMAKKAGPLPIWAWTLLGGGVIAAVVLMHGKIPGIGALTGQAAQSAQGAGGGSGSGGEVTQPPPGSSPPGGGSTPPPYQPPLDTPPPIGQQDGTSGGGVAPSDPLTSPAAVSARFAEAAATRASAAQAIAWANAGIHPTRLEGHPGKIADDVLANHIPTATNTLNNVQHSPPPASTGLEGHPGKQADDLIAPAPPPAPVENAQGKHRSSGGQQI